VNIPITVPGAFCDLCPVPAPGAIIIVRGTDHAMAPYHPLRDQEGRQVGHDLAALYRVPAPGAAQIFFHVNLIYLTFADARLVQETRVVRGSGYIPPNPPGARVPAGALLERWCRESPPNYSGPAHPPGGASLFVAGDFFPRHRDLPHTRRTQLAKQSRCARVGSPVERPAYLPASSGAPWGAGRLDPTPSMLGCGCGRYDSPAIAPNP
jgi:hypothetical protein